VDYVWIGLGSIAGANARYALGRWFGDRYGAAFPYGTFVINVTGALLVGVLLTLLTERLVADPRWRLLLVVGFLGSYTTFSTYTYEAFVLADRGDWARGTAYVLGSNAVGLAACVGGVVLARALGAR
jgi:fluoride exporter